MPETTLFKAIGGGEVVHRLLIVRHKQVMADDIVAHTFSHGFHPQHTARLAAYWGEAWGGPPAYSEQYSNESLVVRMHSGYGPHEEINRHAIECFDHAMDEIGLNDPLLRALLHDYFTWATTTPISAYPDDTDHVPEGLQIPHWSWDGLHALT